MASATTFLEQAYELRTTDDAMQFYSTWAEQYDDQMERGLNYIAPVEIAELLAGRFKHTAGAVLDIGCGTGLTSQYLVDRGYTVIDGLDLSEPMLEQASKRGIYRNLIKADLTQTLDLADGSYAAAMSSGTFTLGHVGPEPIPQVFRLLEPLGYFAFSVHRTVWHEKGFDKLLADMESNGEVKQVSVHQGVFFEGSEQSAQYCIYQKAG